jgi:hypothetical protein
MEGLIYMKLRNKIFFGGAMVFFAGDKVRQIELINMAKPINKANAEGNKSR